jgi:hypothetical protein
MTIWQQTASGQCPAVLVIGHGMHTQGVMSVDLFFNWHELLVHKHFEPNRRSPGLQGRPIS